MQPRKSCEEKILLNFARTRTNKARQGKLACLYGALERTLGHQDRPDKFRTKEKSFGGGASPKDILHQTFFYQTIFFWGGLTPKTSVKLPLFHTLSHSCRH